MYIDVAAPLPQAMGASLLTYALPQGLQAQKLVGHRVAVPFGRGRQILPAFVVSERSRPPEGVRIRRIAGSFDGDALFSEELLELGLWLAQHTVCSPYTAFKAMLPGLSSDRIGFRLHINQEAGQWPVGLEARTLWQELHTQACVDLSAEVPSPAHYELENLGFLRIESYFIESSQPRPLRRYRALVKCREEIDVLANEALKRAPRQQALLLDLLTNGPQLRRDLLARHKGASASLEALVSKGYAEMFEESREAVIYEAEDFQQPPVRELHPDQIWAIQRIEEAVLGKMPRAMLLYGVTGSGKTEVYIHAIEEVLAQGKQALLLLPEIALTMQLLGRLQGALGEGIAVWHSRMSPQERWTIREKMANGELSVLIGARSAIFVPFQDLGLIILDEAHDSSYKQGEPEPRYHAIDVAIKRGQLEKCPVLLGSASPALREMKAANDGRLELLHLPERVTGHPLPRIELVDLRNYPTRQLLTAPLIDALHKAMGRGEQAILYLNRRGFAPMVLCRECGQAITCDACDISMTYHQRHDVLRCHYCDRTQTFLKLCPSCGAEALFPYGFGTEQLLAECERIFPDVRCERFDFDSVREKHAQATILGRFARGESQLLIGTQMLAKGFDFPRVTVCGMVSADLHLNMADYRADELTYQAVMQLAGRAGRGERPGEVYIQSYQPDHPVLLACRDGRSEDFYRQALAMRELLAYPPSLSLARILVSDPNKDQVRATTTAVHRFLYELGQERAFQILGPSAAPIEKIRGRYRVQFLLKAKKRVLLEKIGQELLKHADTLRKSENSRIVIDIDPENSL